MAPKVENQSDGEVCDVSALQAAGGLTQEGRALLGDQLLAQAFLKGNVQLPSPDEDPGA
jgi:hypothetical protein